ncbi:hypothetical protein HWC35_gp071 [Vibrio phage USC-1]|uniref:Uncharacterized protein n=2 Tax=Aphroditevirus USC1 TaxID=2846605 RepID=A0A514A2J0_9CAUD|nr:hypothetical protein HWC35_gp071 [Vibrio phage USC-1]QCW23263.1 hypothetical protein [Vibrio phage 5 TSL-2019]QDH47465.1 hypothetical protein [Vibrio phage USC-1]
MFLKINPTPPYFGQHSKPVIPNQTKRRKTDRDSDKDFQAILVHELNKTVTRGR